MAFETERYDPAEVRPMVARAFAALRGDGFLARMNFWCCQGCGLAAMTELAHRRMPGVPDEEVPYVFFHSQDDEDLRRGAPFHLAWGGDAGQIVQRLEEAGLAVTWDGLDTTRIRVDGPRPPEPPASYLDLVGATVG